MSEGVKDPKKNNRRPVGRPRADGKPHLTRQRVFRTCAKLIAQHGFAGTSIRMMADALDSSSASLFNLFGSKDDLLNELIAYAAQGSLSFYDSLSEVKATPEVLLYKSIYEETIAVACADRDHVGIFYLPELRKPEFSTAQAIRAKMVSHYANLISECTNSGALKATNVELSAEQVFQLTETSIISPHLRVNTEPESLARETAEFCLRALQFDEASILTVRNAAALINLRISPPRN